MSQHLCPRHLCPTYVPGSALENLPLPRRSLRRLGDAGAALEILLRLGDADSAMEIQLQGGDPDCGMERLTPSWSGGHCL